MSSLHPFRASRWREADPASNVKPKKFFHELPALLKDAKPLPGKEARYAQMVALIAIAKTDPQMKAVMIDEAKKPTGK